MNPQRTRCVVLLLLSAGLGQAGAEGAVQPAAELISLSVERSRVLVETAGTSTGARRARGENRLVLRVRLAAAAPTGELSLGEIKVAGSFDDEAATPLALLSREDGGSPTVFRDRSGDHVIVELSCPPPPAGATGIDGLAVTFQLPDTTAAGRQAYRVLADVRPGQGQDLSLPGEAEAWYRVEGFGPKSVTLRRLVEAAPPIDDVRLTNVRDEELQRNRLASSSIRDPSGGGWVAILVFDDHVPLVVNLLVPTTVPQLVDVVAAAERVELP